MRKIMCKGPERITDKIHIFPESADEPSGFRDRAVVRLWFYENQLAILRDRVNGESSKISAGLIHALANFGVEEFFAEDHDANGILQSVLSAFQREKHYLERNDIFCEEDRYKKCLEGAGLARIIHAEINAGISEFIFIRELSGIRNKDITGLAIKGRKRITDEKNTYPLEEPEGFKYDAVMRLWLYENNIERLERAINTFSGDKEYMSGIIVALSLFGREVNIEDYDFSDKGISERLNSPFIKSGDVSDTPGNYTGLLDELFYEEPVRGNKKRKVSIDEDFPETIEIVMEAGIDPSIVKLIIKDLFRDCHEK